MRFRSQWTQRQHHLLSSHHITVLAGKGELRGTGKGREEQREGGPVRLGS